MSPLSNAPALRRRACALALPGIPLAFLLSSLISPTDSDQNTDQLRAAAAHAGRWQAAALFELLAAALFPLAVAGVVHLVRHRGAALAHLAALLGGLGTLGVTSIALRHLYIYGLTATDRASALRVLDRLDSHAGAVAMPLMIAGPLALLLLCGAAARAGLAPRWVVLGAVGFAISDMLPIPAAELIQGAIGVATFGMIALRMLELTDRQWEAPASAQTPPAPGPRAQLATPA